MKRNNYLEAAENKGRNREEQEFAVREAEFMKTATKDVKVGDVGVELILGYTVEVLAVEQEIVTLKYPVAHPTTGRKEWRIIRKFWHGLQIIG